MSLEDALKAKALQLVSQQMANWVVAIQKDIGEHQGNLVKSLDVLQETVARYDEQINEAQIEASILEALQQAGGAPASAAAGPGLDALKASIAGIEQGNNLSEVLTHLVNEAAQYVDRAAIFIVKGTNAIGWYARGVDPPDAVKQINIPLSADTAFRIVANSRRALHGHISHSPGTAQALARMGGSPQGVVAVPLILRDKIAAILYCDSVQEEINQPEADLIEILAQYAGKTIDLLSLAPKTARPAEAPKPAPPKPPPPKPAPPPPPPPPPPKPSTAPMPAADEGSSTVMFNASTFAQMQQGVAGGAPAAPAAPPAAPALSPEEQKAHEDAKRFARLVVSEIKLYNEAKVNEGRQQKDIYERLKEDVERGRQMYSDRVPATVRDTTTYFYDELVRILAGGDPSALGPM